MYKINSVPRLFYFFSLFLIWINTAESQAQKPTISGYVKDKSSGEVLVGVNIFIKELKKGTVSNEYGFYSISLNPGTYIVQFSYLGYQSKSDSIQLNKDTRLNIFLQPAVVLSKEIVISAERSKDNVEGTQMGTEKISIEKIKSLPVIFGETDVLKTLQLLPGIQSGGEGNSGFYVRGGGPDQNLVLLDEATVYNTGHLFGFFSVFNSDAINNVTVIKGGMPAEYGGRLSSVVSVNMKEGNNQRFSATGGIGIISSRLTLEGPVKKNKSSFMVSARRTYIDVLVKPFLEDGTPEKNSGYYFYDLNTKFNYQFSDKDRIFISGYFGKDKFDFGGDRFRVQFPWGNATTSLRWNHLFNNKLFLNSTLLFSDYNFSFGGSQNDFDFKLYSGVRDYTSRFDFDFFPNIRHHIKFGTFYSFHVFTPSTVSGKAGNVSLDPDRVNHQYGHEAAAYITDDFDVNDKLRINAGLRYSLFEMVGPYDYYITGPDNINDTTHYKANEKIAFYHGLEPRFSLRYTTGLHSSVKASYTRTNQYLHLASVSGSTLPADLWIPSSRLVQPQQATQYALGYFRNFKEDMFETSVELYYKEMKHQIEFKESDNVPQINANVENLFAFGTGKSYGAEFFIKKRMGDFNGWIGYTLSYAKRYFPDLNGGNPFYAKYDRRHDASVVLSYRLSDKWVFSTVFVYASGISFSLPSKLIILSDGSVGLAYENDYRNKYRLLPYHRMDVSATFYLKKTEKRESSFNFSIYNVYNRFNQYFVYLNVNGDIRSGAVTLQPKQVTIFPIIPSLTWNFKF